jgi:hypothetical protein
MPEYWTGQQWEPLDGTNISEAGLTSFLAAMPPSKLQQPQYITGDQREASSHAYNVLGGGSVGRAEAFGTLHESQSPPDTSSGRKRHPAGAPPVTAFQESPLGRRGGSSRDAAGDVLDEHPLGSPPDTGGSGTSRALGVVTRGMTSKEAGRLLGARARGQKGSTLKVEGGLQNPPGDLASSAVETGSVREQADTKYVGVQKKRERFQVEIWKVCIYHSNLLLL